MPIATPGRGFVYSAAKGAYLARLWTPPGGLWISIIVGSLDLPICPFQSESSTQEQTLIGDAFRVKEGSRVLAGALWAPYRPGISEFPWNPRQKVRFRKCLGELRSQNRRCLCLPHPPRMRIHCPLVRLRPCPWPSPARRRLKEKEKEEQEDLKMAFLHYDGNGLTPVAVSYKKCSCACHFRGSPQ